MCHGKAIYAMRHKYGSRKRRIYATEGGSRVCAMEGEFLWVPIRTCMNR